jgi:hypothetical protein
MLIVVLTAAVLAIAMGAMAIGVMVTGKRLRGSCGGVGDACACDLAGVPAQQRPVSCRKTAAPATR